MVDKIVICDEEFKSIYKLDYFLKDEFKIKDDHNTKCDIYIIPTQNLLRIARKLFPKIRNACGWVCESDNLCSQHKFLKYLEKIIEFLYYSVEEEMVWYKAFEFFHEQNTDFFGWSERPIDAKCLQHLSYLRRLAYLN